MVDYKTFKAGLGPTRGRVEREGTRRGVTQCQGAVCGKERYRFGAKTHAVKSVPIPKRAFHQNEELTPCRSVA